MHKLKNKKQSKEHIQKRIEKLIGKKRTQKQRKNISKGVQKVKGKISKSLMGHEVNKETRKILTEKSKGNKSHLGCKHTKKTKKKCGAKNKGNIPWNKGLHKEDDERVRKIVEIWSKSQLGRKQFKEFVELRMRNTKKGKWHTCYIRKDLGHLCRSRLEANYCRYLNLMKIKYIHEPKSFRLSNGKLYFPDFYLSEFGMYVETKGYMAPEKKEKIDLFKEEHTDKYLKVLMQDSEEWKDIDKFGREHVDNWEVRN